MVELGGNIHAMICEDPKRKKVNPNMLTVQSDQCSFGGWFGP